jgi:hypothetical protein
MAKKRKQTKDKNEQQNNDKENQGGKNLPVAVEPARTIKESVERANVNPEDIAKNVPYEDSGYGEAGLLDDGI